MSTEKIFCKQGIAEHVLQPCQRDAVGSLSGACLMTRVYFFPDDEAETQQDAHSTAETALFCWKRKFIPSQQKTAKNGVFACSTVFLSWKKIKDELHADTMRKHCQFSSNITKETALSSYLFYPIK